MGMADSFLEVAKLEFFYDQAPESMKSLGTSYSTTSLAIGNFMSSFLLSTVSEITKKRGRGWILNNLNESRLDYYYLFFAVQLDRFMVDQRVAKQVWLLPCRIICKLIYINYLDITVS